MSIKNTSRMAKYITVSAVLVLSGCFDSTSKVEPTYSSLWENTFSGCGVSCHSANAADGTENGPDLSTKTRFYDGLYEKDVTSDYPTWVKSGDCNSQSLIDSGDANKSTLAGAMILQVSDSLKANFSCDSAYSVHAANNNEIKNSDVADALITWINNGAENN